VLPIACAVAGLLSAVNAAAAPADAVEEAPAQAPQKAAIAPGTKKVNPKDGLTYVWIPPGKFQMGCSPGDTECFDNEKPAHEVTITKGFWLGQTTVPQQAYERVTGKTPANHKGPNYPLEEVDWNEATAYCSAIGGRLPTEAEWEYAARAGSTGARYGNIGDIAWYNDNSGNASHEAGQKPPNAFGLYDMLGNAWQWVADWFGPYAPGAQTDPTGPATGQLREPRGGSWGSAARLTRASYRGYVEQEHRGNKLGIRCAAE
jgi:formylglycine-generating enzyme required for sulfatase activity